MIDSKILPPLPCLLLPQLWVLFDLSALCSIHLLQYCRKRNHQWEGIVSLSFCYLYPQ